MLTHHRRPVCLSLSSPNLPIQSTIEAAATLYQKDEHRFHLLLKNSEIPRSKVDVAASQGNTPPNPRLLWLEISPYRVIMTMQGNENIGYRHFWEEGVYGITRYWLHHPIGENNGSLRLRNYTRSLKLTGSPLPESVRVEYELWSEKVSLGLYVLNLEIH